MCPSAVLTDIRLWKMTRRCTTWLRSFMIPARRGECDLTIRRSAYMAIGPQRWSPNRIAIGHLSNKGDTNVCRYRSSRTRGVGSADPRRHDWRRCDRPRYRVAAWNPVAGDSPGGDRQSDAGAWGASVSGGWHHGVESAWLRQGSRNSNRAAGSRY